MNISHQEFSPSPALASVIDRIWVSETADHADELSPMQNCLPLGMIEWIIQIKGKPIIGWYKGTRVTYPTNYFIGLMTTFARWQMYGQSKVIGIRMKPEGAIRMLRQPIAELTGSSVEAHNFIHRKELSILDRLMEMEDTTSQISLLEAFMHHHLMAGNVKDNYFADVFAHMRSVNSSFSTKEIADRFFLSERQMQRLYKDQLGVSPKTYERILRFSRAVETIRKNEHPNWSSLAYQLGYSDQAHLIRDFKSYSGMTPALF